MARSRSAAAVVCDSGPLIHLDELGCLDLLAGFSRVVVPGAVWAEVAVHRPGALANKKVRLERVDHVGRSSPDVHALSRLLSLHRGEVEALCIVQEYAGAILLTDDAAARLAARTLRVEAHGTVGVIIRAIRTGTRSRAQAVEVLRAIPDRSTLFIRPALLDEVIRLTLERE